MCFDRTGLNYFSIGKPETLLKSSGGEGGFVLYRLVKSMLASIVLSHTNGRKPPVRCAANLPLRIINNTIYFHLWGCRGGFMLSIFAKYQQIRANPPILTNIRCMIPLNKYYLGSIDRDLITSRILIARNPPLDCSSGLLLPSADRPNRFLKSLITFWLL